MTSLERGRQGASRLRSNDNGCTARVRHRKRVAGFKRGMRCKRTGECAAASTATASTYESAPHGQGPLPTREATKKTTLRVAACVFGAQGELEILVQCPQKTADQMGRRAGREIPVGASPPHYTRLRAGGRRRGRTNALFREPSMRHEVRGTGGGRGVALSAQASHAAGAPRHVATQPDSSAHARAVIGEPRAPVAGRLCNRLTCVEPPLWHCAARGTQRTTAAATQGGRRRLGAQA